MEEFETRDELAKRLRTSVDTLARWAYLGEGPPYLRIGRKAVYRRSDVEKWLETRKKKAGTAA